MTRWIVAVFFTVFSATTFAQNGLEIKGSGSALFLEHKVAPKESLYSIGRTYNIDPKTLSSFNHLQLQSGLSVGQEIKIPLETSNFIQKETAAPGDGLVPLYHIVQPKETLYRLGVTYNKVPLSTLKKWNHLSSDALSEGSQMIVGFLKVDNKSSLASNQSTKNETVPAEKPVVEVQNKEEVIADKPAVTNTESPKAEKEIVADNKPNETVTTIKKKSSINFSGGYFKKLFEEQVETKSPFYATGQVGTFKSTSGWQDGKYYCFNNDAAPGTIVKITDNNTGNIVYAKVLDAIPDIKQNSGLALILSNAAAEELGAGESSFNCVLSYVK